MRDIAICPLDDHPTVRFAADELARYLQQVSGSRCRVAVIAGNVVPEGIRLGTAAAFPAGTLPAVDDDRLDDALAIQIEGTDGFIAGNNPRSVLLGVYRYLRALGCRWVRPGADGEYLPAVDLPAPAVHLVETPSYRHRALDLVGALTFDYLLEAVAWLPKVGLSGAFLEFDSCFRVCNAWYGQHGTPITPEQADAWRTVLLAEIKKRDLLYHAKGHGWIYEAFGLSAEEFANPLPPEIAPYVALTDGARQVTKYGADATNLCYSHPEARRRFTLRVTEYAAAHPEIDYLHVWLADMPNNHCECEQCREHRPADLYLLLLNEIDTALTARHLSTRIVFLAYDNTLWPPETMTLEHPERFTLMYAACYRSFNTSFADVELDEAPVLPPYRRNRLGYPREVKYYLDFLPHWRRVPHGDSFDFDYHYWRFQYNDPSGLHCARVLHGDIRTLRRLGLNGLVGCYSLRSFYPLGLGLAVMAQTLWNAETSFDAIIEDYFPAALGPDWPHCLEYLRQVERHCDPRYLAGEISADSELIDALEQLPAIIDAFRPIIQRNAALPHPCWSASWRILALHADLTTLLARAFAARARENAIQFEQLLSEARTVALAHEDDCFPALDTWLFAGFLHEKLHPKTAHLI